MIKRPFSPAAKMSKLKLNEYKEAFDIIDKDKKGLIPTIDLIRIFNIFCLPISRRNIQRMINEINVSKDGNFDFNNFVTLMQKQNEYLDENSEEMVLESFKDEYLGNKRKRDDSDINDDELLVLNYENNMPEENKKNSDEVFIKLDETINKVIPNINCNNKKRKLDNINNKDNNSNKYNAFSENKLRNTRRNNSIRKKYYMDEEIEDYYSKKKRRKNKRKNKAKEKKKEENEIIPDDIIIYKNKLPKELVKMIEFTKSINISPIISKTFTPQNKDNELSAKQVVTNFSPKIISDVDFNNISNIKPGGDFHSFASDLSLDFLNKLNPQNSSNKSPPLSSAKQISNYITMTPVKNPYENNEQSEKKVMEEANVKGNNNIEISKNKEINNLLKSENNNNKVKSSLHENVLIIYKKNKDEYYIKDDNDDDNTLKEIEKKRKQINKNKNSNIIQEYEKRHFNPNVQVLNSFILYYKLNKRGERIIINSTEIPYLIIIDKKPLNLDKLKLNCRMDFLKTENKNFVFAEPQKRSKNNVQSSSNVNRINNIEKDENNQNWDITDKKIMKRKNTPKKPKEVIKKKKKLVKNKQNISELKDEEEKKEKIEEKHQVKEKKDEKKYYYDNKNEEEVNKFLNIANIMSNSSVENESIDAYKADILQEKTVFDEDNYYRNRSKINNKSNIKENEGELTTVELLRGFNYLYHQKI